MGGPHRGARPAVTDMQQARHHLVVGLGNPGRRYASTRHNIGFMVADRLAAKYRMQPVRWPHGAELTAGAIARRAVLLAKPLAFMNRSGDPVEEMVRCFGIPIEDMVVIHDDIDLVYGRIKIKEKGGDGGHNGVRSLIDALGTREFSRVRMGVGRPGPATDVVDYVLGEFDADQRATLERFLSRAVEAVEVILCKGAREAMNRLNRKP